jgi:hypothetical protein
MCLQAAHRHCLTLKEPWKLRASSSSVRPRIGPGSVSREPRLGRDEGRSPHGEPQTRPAETSLALRPAGSLAKKRPLSRGFDSSGYPSKPLVSYQINRQLRGRTRFDLDRRRPAGVSKKRGEAIAVRSQNRQSDRSFPQQKPATRVTAAPVDSLGRFGSLGSNSRTVDSRVSEQRREVTTEQRGVCKVTKRADLHPKANSKTGSKTSPLATVQPLALFGSPVLLAGEDDTAYHELLSRVRTAINPVDIIDEMFIADVVSLEWEVLRWRRLKSSLMRTRGLEALEQFLCQRLDYYDHYQTHFEQDLAEILQENLAEGQTEVDARVLAHKCAHDEPDADDKVNQILGGINLDMGEILKHARARKAEESAQDYLQRKPGAIKLIDKLLAEAGVSIEALMVRALRVELDVIERIDRLITVAETRRNAMLREIDRRRAALSEVLRRQVQEVEGEFEVVEQTPGEAKSAA